MSSQEETKNIVIIGGGIIGCTSAYYLTRHPSYNPAKHRITLLEASNIAGGASGKAGGLLALWAYPSSIVPLSFRLHRELAEEHNGKERWGYRGVGVGSVECVGRELALKSGGGRKKEEERDEEKGGKNVSLQKLSKDKEKERDEKLRGKGVPSDLDWISPESLLSYDEMGTPETTAQVHPYLFTTSMAALAQEKGVEIHEHARVTSINYTPDHSAVQSITFEDLSSTSPSPPTTLPVTDLVIATGPWTQKIYPSAPISALRAHSVTIRPSRPVSAYALFTQISFPSPSPSPSKPSRKQRTELVSPEIYPRPNNELYCCGEGDTLIPLPSLSSKVQTDDSKCEEIISHVRSISEELRDGEVLVKQACYLPNVEGGGGPLVGKTGVKGEVLAAGHTCWGIQNGPGTGRVVSEVVFEGEGRSADVGNLDPRRVL